MVLHAEQGNVVIVRDRCKVLRRREMIIFTCVLLPVPKRRLFSTKKY